MDDLALVDYVDDDGSSAEECAIAAEMALVNLAALLATQPGGGLPASRLQDLKLALERTLALASDRAAAASAGRGGRRWLGARADGAGGRTQQPTDAAAAVADAAGCGGGAGVDGQPRAPHVAVERGQAAGKPRLRG